MLDRPAFNHFGLYAGWSCVEPVRYYLGSTKTVFIHGQLKGSVKELNKFHNYETEKITRKASDAAE